MFSKSLLFKSSDYLIVMHSELDHCLMVVMRASSYSSSVTFLLGFFFFLGASSSRLIVMVKSPIKADFCSDFFARLLMY